MDLRNATIVITGASSGIGRATALAFAREGSRVVLAARRAAVLEELSNECRAAGGEGRAIPTDVTDPEAVRRLARLAADASGDRIDVWINNAGVGAVGAFDTVPLETHTRVIQTNLLGYLHGAHAALGYFKRQGRGILINTISLGAWMPTPYAVAYSASKLGLRGFSEALRGELRRFPEIHVCDVFPAFIDTPGFQHAANYVGCELKPAPPVYAPERVAKAMVSLAKRPRAAVTVGASAHAARLAHGLFGGSLARALERFMHAYFARAKSAPIGDGSLFESSSSEAQISGGWR